MKFKRIISFIIVVAVLTLQLGTVQASKINNGVEDNKDYDIQQSDNPFYAVYDRQYTNLGLRYGSWRNGSSGGSKVSSATISLNRSDDESFDISFVASVSGSFFNGGKIGGHLGVQLGKRDYKSLGTGYSVKVPKGSRYLIKYRPAYNYYKVIEKNIWKDLINH